MPLKFNTLLAQEGITPRDVRLLRHQDGSSTKGKTPYELWRDNRSAFEFYQSSQSVKDRAKLDAPFWAAFVVNPMGETLLAGFYTRRYLGLNEKELIAPNSGRVTPVGGCDIYELTPEPRLGEFAGRLIVEWGDGHRSWIQRADNQNKIVPEIRRVFREPDFPGFAEFISPLSNIKSLYETWASPLRANRGIYLLTCPRTKEQYVGKASGSEGFYGRWLDYVRDGHGGNTGLKIRDPSDYQVSILQVAGDADINELDKMEVRWKQKLQSREMGLNRN